MPQAIEDKMTQVNKIANLLRANLKKRPELDKHKTGFKADLLKAIIAKGSTLRAEVLKLEVSTKAVVALLDDTAVEMDTFSREAIQDRPLPAVTPSTIGYEALKAGHKELLFWDKASFEERLERIFAYRSAVGSDQYADWCASFASWCLEQVGDARWGAVKRQQHGNVQELKKLFAADPTTKKFLFPASAAVAPKVGDMVFWKRRKNAADSFKTTIYGHVGFVFSIDSATGRVTTLEGNSKSSVGLHEYKKTFEKSVLHQYDALLRVP